MSRSANFYTGRQRTITVQGSLSINARYVKTVDPYPNFGEFGIGSAFEALISSIDNFQNASISASIFASSYYGQDPKLEVLVVVSNGISTDSDEIVLQSGTGYGPFDMSGSFSADYLFSVDVAEVCVVSSGGAPPSFGGASQNDGMPFSSCYFMEVPRAGGETVASLSWNGGSINLADTIANQDWTQGPNIAKSVTCIGSTGAWGGGRLSTALESNCSATAEVMGVPMSRNDIAPVTRSTDQFLGLPGQGTIDLTNSSDLSTTLAIGPGDASIDPGPYPTVWYQSGLGLPTRYTLHGNVVKDLEGNDNGQDLSVSVLLGDDYSQYPTVTPKYLLSPCESTTSFESNPPGFTWLRCAGFDKWEEFADSMRTWAFLTPSDLSRRGEDARDWRLMFRGSSWNVLELSREASRLIDDGTSSDDWTPASGTTVSEHITYVRIAAPNGAPGAATLATPASAQVWEAFRYLSITASASAAMTVSVVIGGNLWSLQLGTASTTVLLDLCCATGDTDDVTTRESRFPIQGAGPSLTATRPTRQYELGWGVDYADSITIQGIPSGEWVDIAEVKLDTKGDETKLSLLAPFLSSEKAWQSSSATLQPYAFVQTDGRISDWPGVMYSGTTGTWYSIDDMRQMLSYVQGVTCTAFTPPSDGYHDLTLEALRLGGMGSTYDWTTQQWKDWVDVPLSSTPLTIPAQDLFDIVEGYPGIGNPFDGSDYPGPDEDDALPLVTRKILRGQGTGIAYNEDGLPDAGLDVSAWSTDGVIAGVGTVGADGTYRTGDPFGSGNRNVTTFIDGVSPDPDYSSTQVWQNRRRVRTSFRAQPILFALASPPYAGQASDPCGGSGAHASNPLPDQPYAWSLPEAGPA